MPCLPLVHTSAGLDYAHQLIFTGHPNQCASRWMTRKKYIKFHYWLTTQSHTHIYTTHIHTHTHTYWVNMQEHEHSTPRARTVHNIEGSHPHEHNKQHEVAMVVVTNTVKHPCWHSHWGCNLLRDLHQNSSLHYDELWCPPSIIQPWVLVNNSRLAMYKTEGHWGSAWNKKIQVRGIETLNTSQKLIPLSH